MSRTVKTLRLNETHSLKLAFDPLYLDEGQEVDLNRLVFIDYQNLAAEIATFSIVHAGISFILADLNQQVNKAELELKIYKATEKKAFREDRLENKKKFTVDEVDDHVRSTAKYKVLNLAYFNAQHRRDTIDGLYWSMKSKDDKLQKLASTINSQEFINELLNTQLTEINYVRLTKYKHLK